ncbi:RDS/peripherin-like protein xRDS35 [Amblyraja radiata]|uniref:RDS/peripherin-like protein xRDS35 n=1 Tax=Amblyraja radiata TaxID=386614 RepID=UPI001402FA05|nr:RDS/peripherin-like protein xRDS35 [Amblyraja radiata]
MPVLALRLSGRARMALLGSVRPVCGAAAAAGGLTLGLGLWLGCELRRLPLPEDGEAGPETPLPPAVLVAAAGGLSALLAGGLCALGPRPGAGAGRLPAWADLWPGLALGLSAAAAAAWGWSWACGLEPGLSHGLAYALRSYGHTDSPGRCLLKRSVDQLQAGLGCCGVRGPTDWFHVQWISPRFLDLNDSRVRDQLHSNIAGLYLMDSVPFSCCNPASPRPCIQHHLKDPSAHYNYQPGPEDLNLWTRGCHEALLDHYSFILNWVGAALLLSSLLQLALLITMRYLIISTLAAEALADPDCETVGYLLEKGPVDTLRTAAKALRSALSSNAVQTDTAPIVEKMPDK